jgi:hypothetical protein
MFIFLKDFLIGALVQKSEQITMITSFASGQVRSLGPSGVWQGEGDKISLYPPLEKGDFPMIP